MKIALVSPYDFYYPGGVVRHITNLERHLTSRGHTVKIIAPSSGPIDEFGDRFIRIGKPRPVPASGSVARITISFNLSKQVKDVLEKERFDLVHLHEPLCPTLCTTVLRFSKAINVGTFHATESQPSYRWTKPLMISRLYKKWFLRLHGRIAVSKAAMDFVNRFYPAQYDIIPNGIDLPHFRADLQPMEEYMDGKTNLLFVGRMEKRKGLDYLLKAYRLIKPDLPNSRLIIVGPGTRTRHKYEKKVEDYRLKDVVFTGNVSYADLPRYYKTADVFCAPATGRESFGIVLLEAMATATPIVASNIAGYAGVISHGEDGILVPPKNEEALARAIIELLKDKPLQEKLKMKGLLKSANFGWDRVSLKVIDHYTRLLLNDGRQPVEWLPAPDLALPVEKGD